MPPAGFKPITPASERPQTHGLDRAATGIGKAQKHSVLCPQFHIILRKNGDYLLWNINPLVFLLEEQKIFCGKNLTFKSYLR
jgi:hypothetical protein